MKKPGKSITIVGLGLIGGSFAMALKKLNPANLWAVDVDRGALEAARERGIIDEGYMDPQTPLGNSDIVIMCTYPGITISFIRDNMQCFKRGAIITDTAGIKVRPVREINSILREDLDFVAGHPLAGNEYKGLEFASGSIFDGASYIITPTDRNKEKNITAIEDLVTGLGIKRIVRLSPAKHDEVIALSSQLPHVIAATLISGVDDYDTNLFEAGSYRDATRVARINSQLWAELLLENNKNILAQIENFEYNLAQIKRAITDNKPEILELIFDRVCAKKEGILTGSEKA